MRLTPPRRRAARRPHGLLHAVGLGLSAGVLLLVAGLAVLLVALPAVTGSTPLTVLTPSMSPGLPPGTLLVVRPVAPDDVRIGDVVTYQIESGRPEVVSHRVVGVETTSDGGLGFTLQGDANDRPDPEQVQPDQVRGVLWYSLPLVGWVNQAVNGAARGWIVPTLAAVLLAYAAWTTVTGLVDLRRSRRRRRAGATPVARPRAGASRRQGAEMVDKDGPGAGRHLRS